MTEPSHDLVGLMFGGTSDEAEVVRWCRNCGAVVIDLEYDGRTAAGAIMKMRVPTLTQDTHCRSPDKLEHYRQTGKNRK
jgi:hypothetical protein